jgi:hypothetical protein
MLSAYLKLFAPTLISKLDSCSAWFKKVKGWVYLRARKEPYGETGKYKVIFPNSQGQFTPYRSLTLRAGRCYTTYAKLMAAKVNRHCDQTLNLDDGAKL